MENLTTSSHCRSTGRLLSALILCALPFGLLACDNDKDSDQPAVEVPKAEVYHYDREAVESTEAIDLRDPSGQTFRRLRASTPEVFPPCRQIFEEDGEFKNWPLSTEEQGPALFGCDPESFIKLDDGRRIIAYATGMEEDRRATHLQIVFYEADGSIRWKNLMDRSAEKQNFAANYRGSFLTVVDDRLVCAGTLWQGGTQAQCARKENGEVVYDDVMNFWAGIKPFAFDGSLFTTDIRGITRRYPFRGTEMRHRDLEGRGGRSAFYATDQERIFFSPAEDEPILTGWDLETLSPIWRAELPDRPRITYRHVSAEHELLLLKVEENLYGFDTKTGEVRMVFTVGESHPPVTFSDDTLYLLLRRNEDPPLLYAIEPQNGEVRWVALATAGTLQIHYDTGLLLRSVRAVHSVVPADEVPADEVPDEAPADD